MPKWLRRWLLGFTVYLGVHLLSGLLFGWGREDHRLPFLLLAAFFFASVLAWLQSVGGRPKPSQDADTGMNESASSPMRK